MACGLTDATLDSFGNAFRPVYRTLERDPQTKEFIARIKQLKRSTPARPALAIPARCMTRAGTKPARVAPASGGNPAILNGVYRIEWSASELLGAGANWRYVHTNCASTNTPAPGSSGKRSARAPARSTAGRSNDT
jgi:hypothetical protein